MPTYKEINALWPSPMPVPTPDEALAGTKRLIRRAYALAREEGVATGPIPKRKFVLTSGRRYTYVRRGVWYVNPNDKDRGGGGGWGEIVHSISHWAQRRFWPSEGDHAVRHVHLERELAGYAVEHFLAGQLVRPEKAKPDPKAVRAARVAARIKVWQTKRKRADTALRKLRKQARYYGIDATC